MNNSEMFGGPVSAAIVEQLGWVLLHSLWQFAAVALIAEIARQAMRRRSAATRYAMFIVALAAMTAAPVATWMCLPGIISAPLPNQSVLVLGQVTDPYDAASLGTDASQFARDSSLARDPEFETPVPDVATASFASERPSATRSHLSDNEPTALSWTERTEVVLRPWLGWIVVSWSLGVAVCSLRPLLGWHTLRRLKRVGVSPVSDDVQAVMHYVSERLSVRRTVRVLKSTLAQVPVVVGFLRPVVLLPVGLATGLPTEQLEAILAHELAHVRRHDFLVNLLQTLAETFFFYHPAVWWLSRQMRVERENCCDDLVVALLGNRVEYGRALLAIEELRGQSALLALGATDGSLLSRVSRIVGSQSDTDAARWNDRWPVPFVGLACLGMAVVLSVSWNLAAKDDLVRQAQNSDDLGGSKDGSSPQLQNRAEAPNVGVRDWPQFGRTSHRNNVAEGQHVPATWDIKKHENIKWSAALGNKTYSTPIVANGRVFIGTNNAHGYVKEHPASEDVSCLLAFDEQTGKFLWQASNLKLPTGRAEDWPQIGICSSVYCEGSRLWYLTNRAEVVCLDAEGFHDNDENDGPVVNERLLGPDHADMIWRFDMIERLGIRPHQSTYCSVTCVRDRLFVFVNSGVYPGVRKSADQPTPRFVCLDKHTGGLLWTDDSASANVLDSHWSSPCAFEAGGIVQVVMEGGDGWIYSFDPVGDGHGHAKLLWKFDANPKESVYHLGANDSRGFCVATPVFQDGFLYVGVGGNPENGEGIGHLYCIDPTKRGDVSPELAMDARGEPLPPRQLQAVDRSKGEKAIPNPNSAVVWHYASIDRNGDGKIEFDETFHRTLGSAVIADGLLFIADYSGLLHCLDAQKSVNGQPVVHWTHDLLAAVWSTPLIADGKVFIADEDGEVAVFRLSSQETMLAENAFQSSIYATPIVANGTLFVATKDRLLAIAEQNVVSSTDADGQSTDDRWTWGETAKGLRARVFSVRSSMRDDAIDSAERVTKFERADDMAFVVEIENVSDQPIKLLDARDGNGSTDWNGQFLFSIDLFDQNGKPIGRPQVDVVDLDNVLSNVGVATLEPGKTHRALLRPAKWLSPFQQRIAPGSYRAAVRYHGLPARVAARIKEYLPESPTLAAVAGNVVTSSVAFEVSRQPVAEANPFDREPKAAEDTEPAIGVGSGPIRLVWSNPVDGLRAAMEFLPQKAAYGHGEKPEPKLHVQNVSDKPITLASLLWLPELKATVQNDQGESINVDSVWYTGETLMARVTLQPRQVVIFDAGNVGLAVSKERADKFEHVTHRKLIAPAGKYSMQLEGRFGNSVRLEDGKGNVLAPLPGDWIGELKTGPAPLTITSEIIECDIVDAVTGKPVADTTTSFLFIKPKSADSEETTVAHMIWGPQGPGHIYFMIPDQVMQRADREELVVRWGTGGHPDYEDYSPTERIPLKQFFKDDPQSARETLRTIKLTPKKKAEAKANGAAQAVQPLLEFRIAANEPEDGWEPVLPNDWEQRNYRDGRLPVGQDHAGGFAWYPLSQPWRSDAAFVVSRSTEGTIEQGNELLCLLSDQPKHGMLMDGSWSVLEAQVVQGKRNPAPGEERGYAVNVRLDDAGAKRFAELVSSYRDMSLAVVMRGEIVGKLILKEPSARLVFGGHFTKDWAEELVRQLNGLPPDPLATPVSFYANLVTLQTVFDKVLPALVERAGRKLSLDTDSFKAAGVEFNKIVTLRATDESLRRALDKILGASNVKLDYRLSDDGKDLVVFAPSSEKPASASAPPKGLEFLTPYPKLHGLSLDMTEPQFLETVKEQELKTRKTADGDKVQHRIALGDGHTLIVMFDKDAKCSGIQRVRGEDAADEKPDVPDRTPSVHPNAH